MSDQGGLSDWEDQDLLTVDLAAERLGKEIENLRRQIAEPCGDIDVTEAMARLDALVAASRRFGRRAR